MASQWLRGLVRVSRVQQRTARTLVKQFGLLGLAAAKPAAPRKAPGKAKAVIGPIKVAPARTALSASAPRLVSGSAKLKAAGVAPAPRLRAALPGSAKQPAARKPAARAAQPVAPGKWLATQYLAMNELGTFSGRSMSYWLYLPNRMPSLTARLKGWPLVVMLHGCEQTATQFAQGTRMNRLAEQKGFAVLYPQQSLGAHAHRCWKWYEKATQDGGGDVRLIVGIIEQVASRYAIDRSRIYMCGLSAGAGMANIVALNHPELIAAVGLHSAPVFGAGHNALGALGVMQHGASLRADAAIAEVLAARPAFPHMPTILIQGEGDKVVRPINQAQLVRQGLLLNRVPLDSAVSVVLKPALRPGGRNPAHAHQIRDFQVGKKVLLRATRIDGLEHAWSGGDAALAFNAKAGPNASKMMLEFFARHRRQR